MQLAVDTISVTGLLLHDMHNELLSHVLDEIIISRKSVLAVGHPNIRGRSNMGPTFRSGNKAFQEYTMLGSISIRLQAAIEMARNIIAATTNYNEQSFNSQATDCLLCTPSFYHDLSIFQGDIASNVLATATKNVIQHVTSD
jgi:hypothetical protein